MHVCITLLLDNKRKGRNNYESNKDACASDKCNTIFSINDSKGITAMDHHRRHVVSECVKNECCKQIRKGSECDRDMHCCWQFIS